MNTPARPSATVVLLRDAPRSIEVLLLQRNARLAFHGGSWVFPGGGVEARDRRGDAPSGNAAGHALRAQPLPRQMAQLPTARRTAVREAFEETGLRLSEDELVPFAHWTTPLRRPKRFSTWFFVARARAGSVQVDGGEILDHRWLTPADAIAERDSDRLPLPPPTFVTLCTLRGFASSSEALQQLALAPPRRFFPRPQIICGGFCSLYPGDAGYDTERLDVPGPRHRLTMTDGPWRYERCD